MDQLLGSRSSNKGLELAFQAMGFDQEKRNALINLDMIDPKKIPLSFLENLSNPSNVEVSSFLFNNQTSSDILKIRDTKTNDLVVYIPGYTPSFIEAKNENLLIHWTSHQAQSPNNLNLIASHFPLSSRIVNGTKLDAFLYQDYVKQGNTALTIAQGDVFSFITERQKARVAADLNAKGIPVPFYAASIPTYPSTEAALFATIAAAIEYIPYLLPNIHASDLHKLFPSPYKTASEFMKEKVKEKLNLDLDPDTTFIGYFLPRNTFFTEATKSEYSKTQSLTEAALSNYRLSFTPFSSTTIIFTDPSGKGDEPPLKEHHVNVLPKNIEEIIKTADLDTLHKSKLDSFWNAHADLVKYFIKHRYLQQALEEDQNKSLPETTLKTLSEITPLPLDLLEEDFRFLSKIALCSLALEEEEPSSVINPNISIEILHCDNHQSTDIFVFRDTSKERVILYIAGNQKAFFPFTNYQTCIHFLHTKAKNDVTWRELLLPHFCIDVQDSVLSSLKQGPQTFEFSSGDSIRTLTTYPITTKPIEKSLFEAIKKNTQERSYADANALITSDKELLLRRLQKITRAIAVAFLVPSLAFPILNWVSLAVLVTQTSIDLYVIKNGDTVKERHQAAIDAGFNSIGLLIFGFLGFRSLKFSKNQSTSRTITSQVNTRAATGGRGTQTFLKKTPVSEETFFHTTKRMQVWQISASNNRFNHLDVRAWFLDEEFLLFTGKNE